MPRKKDSLIRAESLTMIRDLVALGIRKRITDSKDLVELAMNEGILLTGSDGRPYGRSSVWRYTSSLLFLGFNLAETGSSIIWSKAAESLANAAVSTQFTNELNEREKEIFRTQILASPIKEKFLANFCPANRPPNNKSNFVTVCKPLYVLRSLKRPSKIPAGSSWPYKEMVEFTLDPDSGTVSRDSAMEFLYWYRLWCLDAGLIEEINAREAVRSGIPNERSHILYPLRECPQLSISDFLESLYTAVGSNRRAVAVPVLWLIYKICVDLRIAVQTFNDLLIATWKQHRNFLHLERGPSVLIRGNLTSAVKPYSERYGNHRYYIIIDGTVRTNLILMPRD